MSSLSTWAVHSPTDEFWFVTILLLCVCIIAFIGAILFFMRKRLIEDTPTSKIRSAAQGYVELSGRGELMPGPKIIAPLTGKHCIWYSYRVEECRAKQKKGHWQALRKGQSEELFMLVDDSGQCVIDPEGASVTTVEKDVWYGNSPQPSRGPRTNSGLFASGAYRYTEERLRPRDSLYAIGLFNTVGGAGDVFDPDSDLREIIREWKQDAQSLLARFDTNKDGEIDLEEWQAVRETALKEVMSKHNERKTATPVHMLSKTRDERRPFLLSALPQHALCRRYQWLSLALLLLFFSSGAFVSFAIGTRLTGV